MVYFELRSMRAVRYFSAISQELLIPSGNYMAFGVWNFRGPDDLFWMLFPINNHSPRIETKIGLLTFLTGLRTFFQMVVSLPSENDMVVLTKKSKNKVTINVTF